ncbi:hypothetical protein F5883DRAFT_30722, partial [Diaporthe sp. PMI_573]
FTSSRNHDPSSFAQVLRQRRPRQRRPERPGSAGPPSKSIPGLPSTLPSVAPATARLAESMPGQTSPLLTTAASTIQASSRAGLSTLAASAAGGTASIPPSPPNSPLVLQDPRSQPWTTRSLRLVPLAIPAKRRASHGADTSAGGSVCRTAHKPSKRARTSEPGVEGASTILDMAGPGGLSAFMSDLSGPDKGYTCRLCSGVVDDQPRQQCQICPDVYFCLSCSINSAILHPGHTFKMVEPLITTNIPDQQQYNNHKQLALSYDKADDKADEDTLGQNLGEVDDEEARQMLSTVLRIPLCKVCQTRLFDLRYECQDCPDTNFCSSCRLLESGHTLKLVTSPVIVSNSDGSAEGEAGTDDAVIIQNGMDEDGDFSASPGSDRGGQKAENASAKHINTEHISDDHGSGDVDEHAGSGIENIPSSKECRRIELRSKSRRSPVTQPDVSSQDLSQITKAMTKAIKRLQAVVHAAEHLMRISTIQNVPQTRHPKTHDRKHRKPKTSTATKLSLPKASLSKALLDFPIDFATLDSDGDKDDDGENEEEDEGQDEGDESSGSGGGSDSGSGSGSGSGGRRNPARRKRSGHRLRQWSSRERRRLAQLKQKGWKDGRIGADLGRSASAVAQQWRKQKLSAR